MIKSNTIDNGKLIHTYSDNPDMGLLQSDTGIKYKDAVDATPLTHTYEETPMPSPPSDDVEERVTRLERRTATLEEKTNIVRDIPIVFAPGDAFAYGEKGRWNGKVYKSLIDVNVWNPDEAPRFWEVCA